jgi:N-acetylmuramoyl-L-alanine amidase
MKKFKMKYTIEKLYLTSQSKRRSGIPMDKVSFLVAHDTGNPGSTALQNVKYYERSRDEMSASAHIFVDDRQIIECIPLLTAKPEKAWHVVYNTPVDNHLFGDDANDAAGGIELCFGNHINIQEAYKRFVWTMAFACHVHNVDPIKMITGHYILDPKRKTDPQTALKLAGKTLKTFQDDVLKELIACRN